MVDGVVVAAASVKGLTTAAEVSAGETQPQIGAQQALVAMCQHCLVERLEALDLDESSRVGTRLVLVLPFLDLGRLDGRM